MSTSDRRAMLDRGHPTLSIRGQCRLLGIARSGVYRPAPANDDEDLALMRRIDALFTAWPFLGSRRMTAMLRADGLTVNRKRVQRLMRVMGIAALGPKPRTTKPAPGHRIFPYLLRDLVIDRPNPGVGGRYHLRARRPRLPLSGRDPRLGEPGGAGLAAVEHDGRRVLPRRPRRGAGALRQTGDLQHRPGQPVHQRCLHRPAGERRHSDLDGRGRWMDQASSSNGCGGR